MTTLSDPSVRSALFARKQAGGAFQIVNETLTTGNIFYVDSGATTTGGTTASYGRNPDAPFTTIAAAITNCVASNGDMVFIMPGHAETTTAIAASKIGVKFVGMGVGSNRPTFTATAAATDLLDVTASCTFENIIFVGAASLVTALVDIAANDVTFINCVFRHGAAPLNAVTVASGLRAGFYGCRWQGTANNPNYAILFESITADACADFEIIDCIFNYGRYGLDDAAIGFLGQHHEGGIIKDCVMSGMVLTAIDFNSSSAAALRGLITGIRATAFVGISIDGIVDPGGYGIVDVRATDAVAGVTSPVWLGASTAT